MQKAVFIVEMDCPISQGKEEVFFSLAKPGDEWELRSNGCDINWSGALECLECEKRGIAILKGDSGRDLSFFSVAA